MFSEVQKLAVELNLTGNLRSAVPQAEQQLSGLNRVTSVAHQGAGLLSRGFGAVGSAASKVGGALSHAKNQLLGLVTGPLGMLGLGAGLFSIGGLFKAGTDKAREFGGEVKRLAAVTGLSVETTSRLAGAFDHFGIAADTVAKVAGLAEKNLFALTQTSVKAGSSSKQLTSAAEGVTKAQERLSVAEAKLVELRKKHGATDSALLAAEFKVRDATAALTAAQGKQVDVQGKLSGSVSNASEFAKKYGLALVDASGKVKDFNTLLLDSADFWNNKTIPAQQKAAALNKIYGRSWQDLLPILGAGRAGIQAAEEEAARLGLTITKDNIDALSKAKEATRTWNDALGGLKLQIGFAVMPTLTAFTKGLTVLVVDNRERIVGFIKGVANAGQTLASAFGAYVLPALQSVVSIFSTMSGAAGGLSFVTILSESANFAKDLGAALNGVVVPAIKAVVGGWNALPDQLRTLLIEGFIANKVVKWTFGFDAVGFGLQMAKSFIGGIFAEKAAEKVVGGLSSAASLLKPVPVFVTNPGFGPGGGPGGVPVPTKASPLATGLKFVGGALLVTGVAATAVDVSGILDPRHRDAAGNIFRGTNVIDEQILNVQSNIAALTKRANDGDTFAGRQLADQKALLARLVGQGETSTGLPPSTMSFFTGLFQRALLQQSQNDPRNRQMDKPSGVTGWPFGKAAADIGAKLAALRHPLDALHQDFATQLNLLRRTADPQAAARAANLIATAVLKGVGSAQGTKAIIAELQKKRQIALDAHDHAALVEIDKAIRDVQAKLPSRVWVDKELALGAKIAASNERQDRKISDLTAIQRVLRDRGDTHAAGLIRAKIEELKNRLAATTLRAGEITAAAIAHKKQLLAVNVKNTVNVTATVSARQVRSAEVQVTRYGQASWRWG